jgi:bacteriocin biosynthesis cyclodehydratase domain-containing protein
MDGAHDVIALLDGSRNREQVIAVATSRGVAQDVAERILVLLAAAGVLVDFPATALRSLPDELRRQMIPELASASLCRQDGDGGAQVLARRAGTTVQVCGAARIATTITDLLTSSGIAARCGPAELLVPPADGQPMSARQNAARRNTARSKSAHPKAARRQPPDLAVLVGRQRPEITAALQRARLPHLAVSASEAIGVVGPLVRPGVTACMRCLDLTRAERDPAWPLLLAQLAGRDGDLVACGAALATAVAAQAAGQVLAVADRTPQAGVTAGGTLELVLPGWQWRRRTWLPHPACTCGAASRPLAQ